MDESALATVLELERELQSPTARADEGRLRQLLAPDFVEVGASGREWDRETILGLLREQTEDEDAPSIEILELRGRVIAPGRSRGTRTRPGGAPDGPRSGASGSPAGSRSTTREPCW